MLRPSNLHLTATCRLPPPGLSPLLPGDNDIDQLTRTIATLGSIEPRWPGVRGLPDWGKIAFPPDCAGVPLASLLPGASPAAVAFLDKFLRWGEREKESLVGQGSQE